MEELGYWARMSSVGMMRRGYLALMAAQAAGVRLRAQALEPLDRFHALLRGHHYGPSGAGLSLPIWIPDRSAATLIHLPFRPVA